MFVGTAVHVTMAIQVGVQQQTEKNRKICQNFREVVKERELLRSGRKGEKIYRGEQCKGRVNTLGKAEKQKVATSSGKYQQK